MFVVLGDFFGTQVLRDGRARHGARGRGVSALAQATALVGVASRARSWSARAPDGSERTSRVLAYYHLTGGRIDVNGVMMVPELHDVLGPLMAPSAAD